MGFPCGSADKESTYNSEDLGLIPGLGRSPGEGKGYPLQYSGLENSMDHIVHEVTKSWTWLSNFHFPFDQQKISRMMFAIFWFLIKWTLYLLLEICKKVTISMEIGPPKDFPIESKLDFRSWELRSLVLSYINSLEWIIKQIVCT